MLINEQTQTLIVPNFDKDLPSISTTDLILLMRIDKTLGKERIASAINNAYLIINRQLTSQAKTLKTAESEHLYTQAVMHEAAALLIDNHADFDTLGQGISRSENDKSNALRRLAQHFIADLVGISRNRIKLL